MTNELAKIKIKAIFFVKHGCQNSAAMIHQFWRTRHNVFKKLSQINFRKSR